MGNGQSLSLQDLETLFDERFDEDKAIQQLRGSLGIMAEEIKKLLAK